MSARNLLRIAQRISKYDPLLAYDLEKSVVSLAARNPGAQKFEESLEQMMALLKSAKQDLKKALNDFDTAEEFAKFFDSGAINNEFEELQKLLQRSAKFPPIPKHKPKAAAVAGPQPECVNCGDPMSSHISKFPGASKHCRICGCEYAVARESSTTAGPKDWLKKLWPGKKDKPKHNPNAPKRDEEEYGMSPSYRMDEDIMDEFVEGKKDWADPSHYMEQESRENKEFLDGAQSLIQKVQEIKKAPEKGTVKKLLDQVEALIRKGGNILKGIYQHLEEPGKKVDLGDQPKNSIPTPKPKKTFNLEGTVDHYVDMLKENSGNESKTISLLKELFDAVGPELGGEKASFATRRRVVTSALIRYAHSKPEARLVLLPFIQIQATAMEE